MINLRWAAFGRVAAGAQALFDAGFDVPDLREGEDTLTELWYAVQRALGADRPLPPRYDFRMRG